MKKAQDRILENIILTENHHIIPKSFGGMDVPENMARLTIREHLMAHRLLPKFLTGIEKAKMRCAFFLMTHRKLVKIPTSAIMEAKKANKDPLKIQEMVKKHRGMKRSEEAKSKMSISAKARIFKEGGPWNKGTKVSVSTKLKRAESGFKHSEATKLKISLSKTGKKMSLMHRLKMIGRSQSEVTKQKQKILFQARLLKHGGQHNKGKKLVNGKYILLTEDKI